MARRLRTFAAMVSLLLPWSGSTASQAPQTVVITGRILADDTGLPLRNARVSIIGGELGTPVEMADAEGRFSIAIPAASRATIIASKTGYARHDAAVGAIGQPLELRLRRAAAITGRVMDEYDAPVVAVRVAAETPPGSNGGRTEVAATTTDDRGEYRLSGLSEGEFLVGIDIAGPLRPVRVGPGTVAFTNSREEMFYPGVSAPGEAQPLPVHFGEERSGIDFVLTAARAAAQPSNAPLPFPISSDAPRSARATAVIRGRVLSTDARPLARARVMLVPAPYSIDRAQQARLAVADSDGRFELAGLEAGMFRMTAAKVGYFPASANDHAADGTPLNSPFQVSEGETRERVDISLPRFGTVSGRVMDEYGDPVKGARVQPLQIRYEAGRRQLVVANVAERLTDDLGDYRIYGLAPGQYVVSASVGAVGSEDLPGYGRSYFPGTANVQDAQFVAVGRSQDVVGIDVALTRTRTARVSGRIINAFGEPTSAGSLMLIPAARSNAVVGVSVGARILPDGRFEFPNVPSGDYVVQSSRGRKNAWTEGEFGTIHVNVDGSDVNDLVVLTSTGSSLRGRVTFDQSGSAKPPVPSRLEIMAIPVDLDLSPGGARAVANIRPDWGFELAGITGPRRLQTTRVPAGWALKEIRANGLEVTDQPLAFGRSDQSLNDIEIVLTDRISELSGTLVDDRNRPAAGAHLIVVSTDREHWFPASRFMRQAAADEQGAFVVSGLPFGSYYAAAVSQLPSDGADAWQDPVFLDSLVRRASTVTISEGQKVTRTVQVPSR